jgi:hypothetical protein
MTAIDCRRAKRAPSPERRAPIARPPGANILGLR